MTPTDVSAGTLTISGGSLGSVVVMPGTGNSYSYTSAATFSPGQTLTVTASGATVPAFGPESVTAPAVAVLTVPAATSGTYMISTAADLSLVWTGGQAGAQLIVEGTSSGTPQSYFTCTWDASLGQATIPHAILAGLAGQTNGYFIYGQFTTTNFTAGGYSISESALPFAGGMANYQ